MLFYLTEMAPAAKVRLDGERVSIQTYGEKELAISKTILHCSHIIALREIGEQSDPEAKSAQCRELIKTVPFESYKKSFAFIPGMDS